MTPAVDPVTMTRGLSDLGISVAELQACDRMPFERAQETLASLKERAKHNFRRLCLELHPDRNGGDTVKTERFKMLVLVKSALDKVQIQPPPPPKPQAPYPVVSPSYIGVSWVNPGSRPEIGVVRVPITINLRKQRNGV
jgi:hypothetical protein